jgi:hypothetical protein
MTGPLTYDASLQHAPMLRWLLQRDARTITCQLDVREAGTYEICLLPHWDPSSAVIEQYDVARHALLRHAEVTKRLREYGWIVIDHSGADRAQVAA